MTYAADTSVSVERSKAEIERVLTRSGASKFFVGWDSDQAVIGFNMTDRFVEFRLPLPARTEYGRTATGLLRTGAAAEKAWEQAVRASWRALLLVIKAKLESVESGIETFEQAFLAHILVNDGGRSATIGSLMIPQIAESYQGGTPRLALTS